MHNGKLQLEKRPIELGCGVPKGHKRRLLQTLHSSRFANPFFFVYSLAMAVVTCATATSTCAFASASPSSPTRAKPHAFRSFAACAPAAGVRWPALAHKPTGESVGAGRAAVRFGNCRQPVSGGSAAQYELAGGS